ncbi:unnamed protein product [Rhizoctonia solani]|uniref:Peptidase C14 caspase domain-containing protein n=1 Tax=Rhizoctonia solani TaxID=456999 RepID=A0A8H3B4D0_9AGAM|nr:unnamed protein product [Rhizoctonia solani]
MKIAFHGPSQQLYGLVIGIDIYSDPSLDVLSGAVRDANDVAEFLMSDLDVPAEHIVRLYNEQATRERILEEVRKLWENPNIQHGDPILIYYAGHGGLIPANAAWKERYGAETIQVIFPYDYGCEVLGPTKPTKVNYIRDTTIALMLNRLALEKGDNITVIFDSCHHAVKFGPKLTGQDRQQQNAETQSEIPDETDNNFAVLDDFESVLFIKQHFDADLSLYTDGNPYILLAACQAHQKAIEENGQGLFTTELLKKMRESRVDNITYHDLMESLEMSEDQSPQCYGKHKHRILFNSRVSSRVYRIANRISKLHAVIIGINNYPNLRKLKGAVADADEVARFLEVDLRVPPTQITNLRDGGATRENIMTSIISLQNNSQINHGDPILIYYAGQGVADEWVGANGTDVAQGIFPFDYDNKDYSSRPIQCIPGRTIAVLLGDLSAAKGDNITMIFDSTRSGSEMFMNQRSCIFLAACGSEGNAWEEDGRGVFTMALLKSIRTHGIDKLTYHGLIKSLPRSSSQSPHCYGKHKERILFNSDVPSQRTPIIPVEFRAENGEIVLQAGAASGVTTESIWEIYNSVTGEVSLGTFRAGPPDAWHTVLKPEKDGGDDLFLAFVHADSGARAFARQVRVGVVDELRVYFTPKAKERIFPAGESTGTTSHPVGSGKGDVGYVVHGSDDSADIAVDLDSNGEVSFRLCDRQAEQYEVATLQKRVRAERSAVEEVLFGAAKWKWHLQRKNTDSRITDLVTMELIRVGVKFGRHKKMFTEEERKSINTAGIADFEVNPQDLYGVKLTSQVDQPLYVRMFYFDTTDFSIADIFWGGVGGDPVMEPWGTFMVGDNAAGGTPLQFTPRPGKTPGLAYMKVFCSTKPLELEGLEQKPIFKRASRNRKSRGADMDWDSEWLEWGTSMLTLIQRFPDVQ